MQRAYIKYVQEERREGGGFHKFFKKKNNRMPGADGPQYFMDQ